MAADCTVTVEIGSESYNSEIKATK